MLSAAQSWLKDFRVYLEWPCLRMLFLGFSAGLPLLLILGTLSFWLREAGIDRSTIGYLTWVGLIYAFKWMWAPLVDRLPIPVMTSFFGRRRSWLLFAQMLIILGLVGMASIDPQAQLTPIVWCALLVAFGSATQDIALDAFRIESADSDHQAALAATYQMGYRLALIWSGAGVLWLAARAEAGTIGYDASAWQFAYLCMALSIGVGVVTTLLSKEPVRVELAKARNAKAWLHQTLIEPFADFITRYGVVMGIMANPFYVDMGYTKDEVAAVSKVFGVVMTLLGAFVGGVLTLRFGVMRILFLGAILSAVSNLLFAWLAMQGHDLHGLVWVISADNLSSGIATAAFIAFLSSLTNIQYSATQYALFSSMMLLMPKWLAGFSGVFVDNFGYSTFFISTAIIGAPVLILIWLTIHFKVVEFKKHDSQVVK
ncbi:MAG: AmpG family muropeptide MFS transporter [Polynucleobacter sp. 32-46-5]|nr:MAG: AmpG family muropeptide MFS transporter [Polynucleobacter sp. 32-46-5]